MKTKIYSNGDKYIEYEENEPCSHIGCLSHKSHPCEICGRVTGKGRAIVLVDNRRLTNEKP